MLNRKQAMALTKRLDKIATHVEAEYASIGLSKKEAYDFCLYLDETSDLLERAAQDHEEDHEEHEVDAALLRDEDEPYMDTFDNPHAPHQVEDDEPYMQHYEEGMEVLMEDELNPMEDAQWEASASNWYEQSKNASTSNWYERSKKASASNWYERSLRNR